MESKTLYSNGYEGIAIIDNGRGLHYGDGFAYSISKSTAYKYANVKKEGGQILVNRFGNNKIIGAC